MNGYCSKYACQCNCKLKHNHCAVLHGEAQTLPENFDVSNLLGASGGNLALKQNTGVKMTNNIPTSEELRDEILKYFGAYLEIARWSIPPTQVADKIVKLAEDIQIQLLERLMEQAKGKAVGVPVVPLSVIQGELDSLKGVK